MGPCFSAKYKGEGRSLGSGNAPKNTGQVSAEERRRMQREAAERRAQAGGGNLNRSKQKKPAARPAPKKTTPTATPKPKEAPPPQKPKTQTNSSNQPASERAQKLAEAAERRAEAQYRGLSAEKQQEMKLKAEKDRLLGQITHYYRESGKEVPFGLASCSKEQLKRHLEHVKGMKKA